MGGLFSTPAAAATEGDDSGVTAFHSSAQWQHHFSSVKETSQLLVIDFTALWCGPCRIMEPIFHSMASKFSDVQFLKIDVDELRDVAKEFKVEAMPTFVLVKRGKEVDRIVGAKKEELEEKIEKHRAIQSAS